MNWKEQEDYNKVGQTINDLQSKLQYYQTLKDRYDLIEEHNNLMKQKEWVDNYIRDHVNPVVQQHKELMEREAAEGEKTILKIKKLKHMLKNFHYRMSVKPLDIVNEKGDKVTMTIARRYPSFERLSEEEREKTKLLDYSEDNISEGK